PLIRSDHQIRERGGRVAFISPRPLKRLLSTCPGIDQIATDGDPMPRFDVYAALMSLPFLLGTTLANIPANVPYLSADLGLVERWRRELEGGPGDGLKVGIAWQGSKANLNDRARAFPLSCFAPL